jgi:hypothetical protein
LAARTASCANMAIRVVFSAPPRHRRDTGNAYQVKAMPMAGPFIVKLELVALLVGTTHRCV